MIDHVSLGVSDLARAIAFYDAVFTALGYVRQWTGESGAEYGPDGGDGKFAIFALAAGAAAAGPGTHLAITAPSRRAVDDAHAAGLRLGGADEGAPGLRPQYGGGYYAAFLRDPDGHKLEAVCHEP
jgi:catechol 2,3-dioxygenase-like lactoylglutathione lyase family enzyme